MFETPHKTSEAYVQLGYEKNSNDWQVNHCGPEKIDIGLVNFYKYNKQQLRDLEEKSDYPPRFVVELNKIDYSHNKILDTNITVTLYNSAERKSKTFKFKLYVAPTLIPKHDCNKNKAEYEHLIQYSERIADYCEDIAAYLDIPDMKVDIINHDQPQQKCDAMLRTWLQLDRRNHCWCHFIQALYYVSLNSIAEVAKLHLKHENISKTSSDVISVVEGVNMDMGSPDNQDSASSDTIVSIHEGTSNFRTECNEIASHDLGEANMDLGSPDNPGTDIIYTSNGKSNSKTKLRSRRVVVSGEARKKQHACMS